MEKPKFLLSAMLLAGFALSFAPRASSEDIQLSDPFVGQSVTGLTFSFCSDASGNIILCGGWAANFQNNSDTTWSKLLATVSIPSNSSIYGENMASDYGCGVNAFFGQCVVNFTGGTNGSDNLVSFFFSGQFPDGINSGSLFSFSGTGWGDIPLVFNAAANVPEPATGLLLLSGLALLAGVWITLGRKTTAKLLGPAGP